MAHSHQLTEAELKKAVEDWVSKSRSLSIAVVGNTGSGKSTLINSLIGCNVAKVGKDLVAETTEVSEYKKKIDGVEVSLYDTPGLADPFVMKNVSETLGMIAKKCPQIDLLLFSITMEQQRISKGDVDSIKDITDAFGKDVWKNAVFALTFANRFRLPIDSQEQDLRKYFEEKVSEWTKLARKALNSAGLEDTIADEVPVVPTGHRKRSLPDREDWFTAFWTAAFIQIKSKAQPALLKINKHRLRTEEESSSLDTKSLSPEERPIVMDRPIRPEAMGLKSKSATVAVGSGIIGAGIGSLIGLIAAGPLGATAGAWVGAKTSAVVGVGATTGGALAYYIGNSILKLFGK